MPDLATLDLLRQIYWAVYLPTLIIAAAAFILHPQRPIALGRAVAALALASAIMVTAEGHGGGAIGPLAQFLLDLAVLALVTMPPKSFWQASLGALVMAQVGLSACWLIEPLFAQWHYWLMLLMEFAKCAVLLLWAGGARVQGVFDRIAGRGADLVLAARGGKLAR